MLGLHPKEAGAPQQSQVKEAQGNALLGAVLFSPQLSRLDAAQVLTHYLLLLPPCSPFCPLTNSLTLQKVLTFLIWRFTNEI